MQPIQKKAKTAIHDLFKNADSINERLEEFGAFCINNKRIINKFLQFNDAPQRGRRAGQQAPDEPNISMKDIVRFMPHLLTFENKRAYFQRELQKRKKEGGYHRRLRLRVDRESIFMDTYAQLNAYTAREMRAPMEIQFKDEAGIDAGGVSRDFFVKLSQEMFNPNHCLFSLQSNGVSFHPNQ